MNYKIEKIAGILGNNPDIEFSYLFGSQIKGVAGEKSDWDIAVYFKDSVLKRSSWTVFYLEAEISAKINAEVQISILNNLDSPVFLFQIIGDGLLLTDKSAEKRILFEARAMAMYHDWGFFLRRQMADKR